MGEAAAVGVSDEAGEFVCWAAFFHKDWFGPCVERALAHECFDGESELLASHVIDVDDEFGEFFCGLGGLKLTEEGAEHVRGIGEVAVSHAVAGALDCHVGKWAEFVNKVLENGRTSGRAHFARMWTGKNGNVVQELGGCWCRDGEYAVCAFDKAVTNAYRRGVDFFRREAFDK